MKTKFLLGALCLPVVFAACTSEDIVVSSVNDGMPAGRAVVDLKVAAGEESRMAMGADGQFAWEEGDKLGSVLVDPATLWTVDGSILGNNRWDRVNNHFTTQGTTVEGAWMFYFPYDPAVSKRGNGIKVTKSIQYQEYDADGSKMAANDFRISPVYFINAAEGGQADIEVCMNSVYAYGQVNATFEEDVIVDKVLIKAEGVNKFNDKLQVNPLKVAQQSSMNYVKNLDGTPLALNNTYAQQWIKSNPLDSKTWVPNVESAEYALQDWADAAAYNAESVDAVVTPVSQIDYILVRCGEEGVATTSKKFSTNVLFPADAYNFDFDVYFYTNKGVYKYNVDPATYGPAANLLFKRGCNVQLHNVNKLQEVYEGMNNVLAPTTIAANTKELDPYIVENKDLVAHINSITTTQAITPRMLGTVTIDDAVVSALNANSKVTALNINLDNIDITCTTQTINKLFVANNQATLKNGANVTFAGGSIKHLVVEAGATATLESNIGVNEGSATVKGTLNLTNKISEYRAMVTVDGGTLNVGTAATPLPTITTYLKDIKSGSMNINVNLINGGSASDANIGLSSGDTEMNVVVNANVTSSKKIILNSTATLENNATLSIFSNDGEIVNNGTLTVGTNSEAAVISNYAVATVGSNEANAFIYNNLSDNSELECTTNYGTIEATNSKAETTVTTNEGEIIVQNLARIQVATNNGDITYSAPEGFTAIEFSDLDDRITKIEFEGDFTYDYATTPDQSALAKLHANVKSLVFNGNLTLNKDWALNDGSSVAFVGAEANITGKNKISKVATLSFGVAEVKNAAGDVIIAKVATDGFINQGTTISGLVNLYFFGDASVWNNGKVAAVTPGQVNFEGSLQAPTKAQGWKGNAIQ